MITILSSIDKVFTLYKHLCYISAYTPMITNEQIAKELFHWSLDSLIARTPAADKLIILGDFNARVGKEFVTWS